MKKLVVSLALVSSSLIQAAPVASGTLVLPKDLAAKAKGIRTVFISVLDPKAASPMPCAAQKFSLEKDASGEFLAFTIGEDTLTMMACPTVPETMNLKVKLDKDGSAGRDSAGDIVGTVTGVKKGSAKLKVSVDKVID